MLNRVDRSDLLLTTDQNCEERWGVGTTTVILSIFNTISSKSENLWTGARHLRLASLAFKGHETLQTLQIAAITLASLSGLFGIYFVLFMLAIWATYQQGTVSSKRLRWVTIVLFLDLLIHFTTRSLEFSRARLQNDSDQELLRWTIPLTIVGNVTTTIAALLSDGILAWRFYVVFCREKWALYIPATAVVANAFLCWSADVQHLAIYFNRDFYEKTLLPVTLDITVAWGWFIFLNNTVMTGGILYKVIWASRAMQSVHDGGMKVFSLKYDTILHAVIESALVTWIGILIYEIAALAPTGHVTTHLGIGFVILDIIPIFFGISQCLITARVGLARAAHSLESTDYYSSETGSHPHLRAPTYNDFASVSIHLESQVEALDEYRIAKLT